MDIDKKFYNCDFEKPLTSQKWKNFNEHLARNILKYIDQVKYDKLVCNDKPDLQLEDKSLGIEVIESISKKEGQIQAALSRFFYEMV